MKSMKRLATILAIWTAVASPAVLAEPPRVIAIALMGPDGPLEETVAAFKGELARNGLRDGQEVRYVTSSANFDASLIPQTLAQLQAQHPSLLFSMTTGMTQAAKSALRNDATPIVFGVVADPVRAQLVPDWEHGSERMVGASNLIDMDATFSFIKTLMPHVGSIGLPFNPGEINDVANLERAQAAAQRLGLTLRTSPVSSLGEIAPRILALRGVDAIYVMGGNLLMPAAPAISAAADQIGVPLFSMNQAPVGQHVALASLGISYTRVGEAAAHLAIQILDGKKPADLANYRPTPQDHRPLISARQLAHFKMSLPSRFRDCKCVVE